MNILHVYKTYHPDTFGGVEQFINQLCRVTSAQGVHNEVFTLSHSTSKQPIKLDNHWVHQMKRTFQIASSDFSLAALGSFKRIACQADLIHYHYPWPYMDIMHFFARLKKPTVLTYHSDIIRQKMLEKLYNPLKYRFLNTMDCIVATSPNYLHSSSDLTRYEQKTAVIPIGLDEATYPLPDKTITAKWQQFLPPRFFFFVGVLRYYKGLHILLQALKITPFPVVIAGTGPIVEELKALAYKNNLSSVHFLGAVSEAEKVALYTLSYAAIFPSHLRSEAFGISLLEGAMYAKPLISCDIGTGTSYININQKTGLVVKPNCARSLAQAMATLWDDPNTASSLGLNAKERFHSLFTAQQMGQNYLNLYQSLLNLKINSSL